VNHKLIERKEVRQSLTIRLPAWLIAELPEKRGRFIEAAICTALVRKTSLKNEVTP
jgi:hypothetical protein